METTLLQLNSTSPLSGPPPRLMSLVFRCQDGQQCWRVLVCVRARAEVTDPISPSYPVDLAAKSLPSRILEHCWSSQIIRKTSCDSTAAPRHPSHTHVLLHQQWHSRTNTHSMHVCGDHDASSQSTIVCGVAPWHVFLRRIPNAKDEGKILGWDV